MGNTTNYNLPYPEGTATISGSAIADLALAADTYAVRVNALTTKGDLAGYSTAPARIPVGSDGQYLMSSGTADNDRAVWNTLSGTYANALDLIAESTSTATSGVTSVAFTSIPSTYSMLILQQYASIINNTIGLDPRTRFQINSNGGSVYASQYGFYGAQNDMNNVGTASTTTFGILGVGGGWDTGATANATGDLSGGAVNQVSLTTKFYTETYFPNYADTSSTAKSVLSVSYAPQTIKAPQSIGSVGTVKYIHFADQLMEPKYAGNPINAVTSQFGSGVTTFNGVFELRTQVPLSGGTANAATIARTALGGTTTIIMNNANNSRYGLLAGDVFVVNGYSGTATGVNGTWTATVGATSGVGSVTWVSGVDGTIAASTVGLTGAFLNMTQSAYYSGVSATQSHSTSAADIGTAMVQIGGTFAPPISINATRYDATGTAINSLTIDAFDTAAEIAQGSIFRLYGVK